VLANTPRHIRDRTRPWLLAPVDLQTIKAAGVTFAISMLERVVEEQARGDAEKALAFRASVVQIIGEDLSRLKPGSEEAAALKRVLIEKGAWSQYLEVGIGPDAEVFTKAPVLSASGTGLEIGIHPHSTWNNPEPEIAIVVSSSGKS
jgi:fumarylacetoacetate (FAA) hydrolase family protein